MLRTLTFDLETDGLLDEVTKVHVLVLRDRSTGIRQVFRQNEWENTIHQGLAILTAEDTRVVAHNGIGYDFQVLKKLYGITFAWFRTRDTMVLSKLVWSDMAQRDLNRRKKRAGADFPGQLIGRHSLESWGHRLGEHKGDYRGDPLLVEQLVAEGCSLEYAQKEAYRRRWWSWNQAMEDYCVQDDVVTNKLLDLIEERAPNEVAVLLETQTAYILQRQEAHGFCFDTAGAAKLYGKLAQRRLELEDEVRLSFRPRYLQDGKVFTPARDNKTMGYTAGAPFTKVVLTEFNPTSRQHVATWLKRDFDWEPEEFTADGHPKIDDEVIGKLPFKEAAPLKEYFMVCKRIGQIAEGNGAWLRKVAPDGRIHGRVNTNGAVTGRMTHMDPNLGQVPSGRAPYGHECRHLFGVPAGKRLVGIDAEALELRDLAGYMARHDDGAYIETVLRGDKSQGTDMHSINARALGLDPKGKYFDGESGRDIAKTWFYAFIYGAGDEKLGTILLRVKGQQAIKRGKAARRDFLANLPAMGKLVEGVKNAAKQRGYLIGLDGRHLPVRSQHAALNTLLQAAGAVQMKRALCIFDDDLQALGLIPGVHYEFVANVHDEWQLEVDLDHAEKVREVGIDAIRKAGESFGFRCPLAGAGEIGLTWADTH